MARSAAIKSALTSFLLAAAFSSGNAAARQPNVDAAADKVVIELAALPPQGRQTYNAIRRGGPFAYDKDGSVFGNRERQLPDRRRGHYREYTVPTPGARDRGARRIVCGGAPRGPEACWYSADHYASFRRIVE